MTIIESKKSFNKKDNILLYVNIYMYTNRT